MLVNCNIPYDHHNTNSYTKPVTTTCLTKIAGSLGPILIPPMHILVVYYFWRNYNRPINKHLCSCSCWDSIFKGPYESGIASYKHVYFNSTQNSFKMWILTVISVLFIYESICRIVYLILQKRARYSMVVLFISSLYSHYYSWWMFFNYLNDEFYSQWYHQLFFSMSELASSALVLLLADRQVDYTPTRVLSVAAIATVHILISGWDQFIINVLRGDGYSYQVVRDIGFMVPDLLHTVIPLWQMKSQRNCTKQVRRRDFVVFSSTVVAGLLIASFL